MSQTEVEFVSNFLALLSTPIIQSDYKKDLKDVIKLNPLLPKLPNNKNPINKSLSIDNKESINFINVNFKSIKSPKFNINAKINSNDTIYKIKSQLLKNNELIKFDIEQINQLKFLIKGKVIQDSTIINSIIDPQIKDVNDEIVIKFTVLVSPRDETIDDIEPESNIVEIDQDWEFIAKILLENGIDSGKLKRLQKGWELTK
ncbi:hypothetical protein WICMUC_003077 [Wickerhamomyces mucosus]|uniref:Ubiquitin-like domain-containing protein n=1 Tax=Wickerhamomyces mucosus TaxID=1378264 RepID=A0A9P8PNJ0_9ASCO|nr:hypothetical protein WICMUC_003077 [Wickerhamomyces mucosus]